MKPEKFRQLKVCDYCRRVGLIGYMYNPTPGWLYESSWMCKNPKACAARVAKNTKEMMEFKNVNVGEEQEHLGQEPQG